MKIVERIKMAIRRRKKDRRIIRQAKAMGVWGKPMVLGGRALELYAKKHHRLKREPGESDRVLRLRILNDQALKDRMSAYGPMF